MFSQQSPGSKLGAIAGLVIAIAFFLPWVRACGVDLTGYDIATNSNGRVEDPWMYWGTLLAGLFCIALLYLFKTDSTSRRTSTAGARLIASLIGSIPLLNIWLNVRDRGGSLEILYGGWITVLGYIVIYISTFIDLLGLITPGGITMSPNELPAEGLEAGNEVHESLDTSPTQEPGENSLPPPHPTKKGPQVSSRSFEKVEHVSDQMKEPTSQEEVFQEPALQRELNKLSRKTTNKICVYCGSGVPEAAIFCPICGSQMLP